jgi:protein TonB
MKFRLEVPVPEVVPDRAEPTMVAARMDDQHVDATPVIGKMEPPVVVAARATARPAVLDAGALGCRPAYPAAAQRAGATGVSKIRFTVDALGHVAAAQILQSSGPTREHRLMDKAAADALAACPVTPGTDESGRAVGGTADVEYVWKLN